MLPLRLRIGSVASILIYALIVVIAFDRLGAIDVFPEPFSVIAMWVIFGYFTLGIFMNAISRSKPERNVMTPVCVVLAVLSLFIALGVGSMATRYRVVAQTNPSGSVNDPASLLTWMRCEPEPSAATPADLASARRL